MFPFAAPARVGDLSWRADSVPALSRLPAPLRENALARLANELERDEPWSSANLSRRRARELLTRPPSPLRPLR
jgi:hypothetical protein